MSDGCHANTSTFARRKATSALSYLGSRVALMVKVPPVPSSLADTFLVSGGAAIVFLHLPVELDGASSTVAQHSEEVRLPEWASELLPDLVFFFLDPRTPMGPVDLAPFGSAGGGDRTKSRSRRSTRAVYPASELSGEITLLLLHV